MSDQRTRCPNRHPGTRGQCGLPVGHTGDHTLLMESGAPWFPLVSPVASSATPTPADRVECAMAGQMSDVDAIVVLCGEIHRLRNAMEMQAVTIDSIHTVSESNTRLRAALERAYNFAFTQGAHDKDCPLGINIEAPDDVKCACGYDAGADACQDDMEALGIDFWKVATTDGGAKARRAR